jgi:hypothetical protein
LEGDLLEGNPVPDLRDNLLLPEEVVTKVTTLLLDFIDRLDAQQIIQLFEVN